MENDNRLQAFLDAYPAGGHPDTERKRAFLRAAWNALPDEKRSEAFLRLPVYLESATVRLGYLKGAERYLQDIAAEREPAPQRKRRRFKAQGAPLGNLPAPQVLTLAMDIREGSWPDIQRAKVFWRNRAGVPADILQAACEYIRERRVACPNFWECRGTLPA